MAKRVSRSEHQANSPTTRPRRYLEFTKRSHGTYLLINKRRGRLLELEKVIRLSVVLPFLNIE